MRASCPDARPGRRIRHASGFATARGAAARATLAGRAAPSLAAQVTTTATSPSDAASPSPPRDSLKLEVAKSQKAIYPIQAAQKSIQGEVWVKLSISEVGEVENVEVLSGDPTLTRAAVDAAKKWRFEPFIKNGKAIKVTTKLPFDFALGAVKDPKDADAKTILPPATSLTSDAQKVRVSSGIAAGRLIHQVSPVYPPEAKEARISGMVVLKVTISKEGRMEDVRVVSGHPMLIQAAVGAVQQWRYRPYLLMSGVSGLAPR